VSRRRLSRGAPRRTTQGRDRRGLAVVGQPVRQRVEKLVDVIDLPWLGDEPEARGPGAGNDGTLVEEPHQHRPRGRVEGEENVEVVQLAPGRSRLHLPRESVPQLREVTVEVSVLGGQPGEDVHEPSSRGKDHALVKGSPPDAEHGDEIVADEEVRAGLRSAGGPPGARPARQAQVAGRRRRLGGLGGPESLPPKRGSRDEDVADVAELRHPMGVGRGVALQADPHVLPEPGDAVVSVLAGSQPRHLSWSRASVWNMHREPGERARRGGRHPGRGAGCGTHGVQVLVLLGVRLAPTEPRRRHRIEPRRQGHRLDPEAASRRQEGRGHHGGDVALGFAPLRAAGRDVARDRLALAGQELEALVVEALGRDTSQALHHAAEDTGVRHVEVDEQVQDRLGRAGAPGEDLVSPYLVGVSALDQLDDAREEALARRLAGLDLRVVSRRVEPEPGAVQDREVLGEGGGHEVEVHSRDLSGRDPRTRLVENLDPSGEADRVETLLAARLVGSPQVEVEEPQELLAADARRELARLLEPPAPHRPQESLRLQVRREVHELGGGGPTQLHTPTPPF